MLPSSCCLSSYFIPFLVNTFYFWRFKVNVHVTYTASNSLTRRSDAKSHAMDAAASARGRPQTQDGRKVDAERTQAGRTRGHLQTQNARKLPAGRTRFLTSYFLAVLYKLICMYNKLWLWVYVECNLQL